MRRNRGRRRGRGNWKPKDGLDARQQHVMDLMDEIRADPPRTVARPRRQPKQTPTRFFYGACSVVPDDLPAQLSPKVLKDWVIKDERGHRMQIRQARGRMTG